MSKPIIELQNVSFRYDEADRQALSDVSLKIYPEEWIAIIGPNGSGKSTLAKIINGLLIPSQGQVFVNNQALNENSVWDARRTVGMVFQNPDNQFVGATVEDDVAFGLENNGVPRPEMIERVNDAVAEVRMLEHKTKEPARLSGGQKQRVAIASVIALRPQVILLDESTAMLDPLGREEVIESIDEVKEQFNLTVISITHDIDEASRADRILVMEEGRLVKEGSPAEIFSLGDKLVNMGLDVPFSQQLKDALAQKGVDVPEQYLDEEEMLAWINTSFLTK